MDAARLLEVNQLATHFPLREGVVRAVNGASLAVARGRTLGVVGESGCGKSVLAQSILQIVPKPGRIVQGAIEFHAPEGPIRITDLRPGDPRMRALRGSRISLIFQEPLLPTLFHILHFHKTILHLSTHGTWFYCYTLAITS